MSSSLNPFAFKTAFLNRDAQSKALAEQWGLALVHSLDEAGLVLDAAPEAPCLYAHLHQKRVQLSVLQEKTFMQRLDRLKIQPELVLRAVGVKGEAGIQVLDATTGFGFDAITLAKGGMNVLAVEREPILAALLSLTLDSLKGFENLKVRQADSQLLLQEEPVFFDVIYLDPMFPKAFKGGPSSKYMQTLQWLLEEPLANDSLLLKQALKKARKKVVVKRPLRAPYLEHAPNHSLKARTHRFDIYLSELT